MAYQKNFWKGESKRTHSDDRIRPNPEAPPMHEGPGASDESDMSGADLPNRGTSQPRTQGNKKADEFPLRHANVKPRRHSARHQVLMAQALRHHSSPGTGGTTEGTAVGGGAAGGGAGS